MHKKGLYYSPLLSSVQLLVATVMHEFNLRCQKRLLRAKTLVADLTQRLGRHHRILVIQLQLLPQQLVLVSVQQRSLHDHDNLSVVQTLQSYNL